MGFGPDIGLVTADPVGFGFGLNIGDGLLQTEELKEKTPHAAQRFQALALALIQP